VTPCGACHVSEGGRQTVLQFRFTDPDDCRTCHRDEGPHEGAFDGASCEMCHTTASFLLDTFEHDRPEVREWIEGCGICHGEGQPHGNQFQNRECGECHATDTFKIPLFDHAASRFPLEGAHRDIGCTECHRQESRLGLGVAGVMMMVKYKPLDLTCAACHGGGG